MPDGSSLRDGHSLRYLGEFALIDRIVGSTTAKTILDPFMGSGTTAISALNFGRDFIGIELKRSYWEAACRNLERAGGLMTLWDEVPA